MKKIILIGLIVVSCKSKPFDLSTHLNRIDSIVKKINHDSSLQGTVWLQDHDSAGRPLLDTIFNSAEFSIDEPNQELEKAVIFRKKTDSRYHLYFEGNKLIKAEMASLDFDDFFPRSKFYFENRKILNAFTNQNKDSLENFYMMLSDHTLWVAGPFTEKDKKD
jgi:hypothetical protein